MNMANNLQLRKQPSLWEPSPSYFCVWVLLRHKADTWILAVLCSVGIFWMVAMGWYLLLGANLIYSPACPMCRSGQDMGELKKWGGGLVSSSGCDGSKARTEVIPTLPRLGGPRIQYRCSSVMIGNGFCYQRIKVFIFSGGCCGSEVNLPAVPP